MKKTLIVFALLIISIGMIYANDNSAGIMIAPESYWAFSAEGQKLPDNTGSTLFYLMADGANYFGGQSAFGVEYGIGAMFTLNSWSDGVTVKAEDAPVGLMFYLGPGYRYEFSDYIGITAGIGLRGTWYSQSESYSGQSATISAFNLEMYGKAAVDFTIFDCLRLDAGIMLGGPVYNSTTVSMDIAGEHRSETRSMSVSGFFLTPFVGVSYAY